MRIFKFPAVVGLLFVFALSTAIGGQAGKYENARALVGQVLADVQQAAHLESAAKNKKEKKRNDNAIRRLSDLDKDLSKGKFNKGKVNGVVNGVKDITEHNTLAPADRDKLNQDLQQLRDLRTHH